MTTTEKLAELVRGFLAPHASFTEAAKLHDEAKKTLAAYDAELNATPAAPQGWKLVPVEPTPKMLKAADDGDDAYTLRHFGPGVQRVQQGPYDHWCAMLAAAPEAGQGKESRK